MDYYIHVNYILKFNSKELRIIYYYEYGGTKMILGVSLEKSGYSRRYINVF